MISLQKKWLLKFVKSIPMSSQLTEHQRAQIVALAEEGWTVRRLAKKFKVSISTISRTINNNNERITFSHYGNNGRPSKCSNAIINSISD